MEPISRQQASVGGAEKLPVSRECPNCKSGFRPKRINQRFCSRKCKEQAKWNRRHSANKILEDRKCVWCGSQLSESKRPSAKFCSARCRKEAFKVVSCYYCGEPAHGKDHFIPQAFVKKISDLGWVVGQLIVPACTECNSTAGDRVFRTLSEKRYYIHKRYKEKYAKLLNSPLWTKKEIDQLGPSLRDHILHSFYARQVIEARLRWPRIKEY